MWDLAVRENDYEAVDGMLRRYEAPLSMRIPPAYARGDSAAILRLVDSARGLDARQSQIAARYVATYLEDFATAAELARLDLQPRRNAAIRLGAQTWLAWLEVGRGRWAAANRYFVDAQRMPGGDAVLPERALAATLPFVAVPRSEIQEVRREVERWSAGGDASPSLAAELRPHLRIYLLGLLSSRLDEHDRALSHAGALDTMSVPEQARGTVRALAATVRADVAFRRGEFAQALSQLEAADGRVPLELVYLRPFVSLRPYTQEYARYLRAEALLELGRLEEAARWFETSFQGSPLELVYLAPLHERLALIHERRGDGARARAHAARFKALRIGTGENKERAP